VTDRYFSLGFFQQKQKHEYPRFHNVKCNLDSAVVPAPAIAPAPEVQAIAAPAP
jgi:hypothetical protein